LQDKTANLPL